LGLIIPNVTLGALLTTFNPPIANAPTAGDVGMLVYNMNGPQAVGYYYWNGTTWVVVGGGGAANAWLLTGNSGTTPGINYLGTNDANALEFKVNGQKSGWIDLVSPFSTSLGFEAANANTGIDNAAIGYKALFSNTAGTDNTAVGFEALNLNVSGSFNTAVGSGALQSSIGSSNTATGYDALFHNAGSNNTANGYYALVSNTSGINNTTEGYEAGWLSTNVSDITAMGAFALNNNLSGFNTALGYEAGLTNTIGSYNTYLGIQADASANNYSNASAIGANAYVGESNAMVLGSINGVNGGTSNINVGIGVSAPVSNLDVNGSYGVGTTDIAPAAGSTTAITNAYSTIIATPPAVGNTYTLTLPSAAANPRQIYTVVYNGTGTGTIDITSPVNGSIMEYGAAVTPLAMISGGSFTLQSDGTNWNVISAPSNIGQFCTSYSSTAAAGPMATLTWYSIPGLNQNFTLTNACNVVLSTAGGILTTGTGDCQVQIDFLIDGTGYFLEEVVVPTASHYTSNEGLWSGTESFPLAAGVHNVQVWAIILTTAGAPGNITAGGAAGSVTNAFLTVDAVHN